MKAVTRTKYGQPSVLVVKEIEQPKPKPNELLVRVICTTVNRTDCGILTGKPYLIRAFTGLFKPSSLVPGTDFSGVVEEVGANVTDFKKGDRVWGLSDEGLASQAGYMAIQQNKAIAKIPAGISYEHAVCAAEGAHYAYNFITKVKLQAGDKVLVNGASGAIGSAAVQLLHYFNIQVTAVTNTKNVEMARELGATKVYDYLKEDFTKEDTNKYKVVLDAVGKSTFGKCKHLLEKGGVYMSSELGPNAENLYLPFSTKFMGDKRVIFPVPVKAKRSVLFMNRLLSAGKYQPVIDKEYAIEVVGSAYEYVMTGEKSGNVLLKIVEE